MEVKRGYKRTEVGVIPEDWETCQLGSLGSGFIPPIKAGPFGSSLTKDLYVPVGYKVYGQEQVIRGDYRYGDYFITAEKYRELQSCAVSPGDVLLSLVGTLGKLLVLPDDAPSGIINPRLVRLSFDRTRVHPTFFKSLFESSPIQKVLARCAQGGTMGVLNAGILRSVVIPLPALAEQEAIAEALSDADALIESLEQLIAKKRQIKQGAMQDLLTGKKRLPGFELTPGYKQTEVGAIPKDWGVTTLARLCSMKSGDGITSASIDHFSEYPCYGGNGLRGFATRFTHNGEYALVGRQGALCGNVLGVNGKFFASEHAIVVTPCEQTDIRWLTFVLGRMRLNQYSESSAQPGLSVAKLLGLDLAHPTAKAEQEAIATVLSDMDSEIAALEAKLAKARQLKQGMMQELLTGRIRLV